MVASFLLVIIFGLVYCNGLIMFARKGLMFEACITVCYPLCCCLIKSPELLVSRLVVVESLFNLLCLGIKVAQLLHIKPFFNMKYLFLGWGAVQIGGFLVASVDKGASFAIVPHGMLTFLGYFILQSETSPHVDSQGRVILFSNENAWMMPSLYAFWFLNAHFVDKDDSFPNLGFSLLQCCSVAIASVSGEFWHARLLTASHLIISRHFFTEFLHLPEGFARLQPPNIAIFRQMLTSLSLIGMVGVYLFWRKTKRQDKESAEWRL